MSGDRAYKAVIVEMRSWRWDSNLIGIVSIKEKETQELYQGTEQRPCEDTASCRIREASSETNSDGTSILDLHSSEIKLLLFKPPSLWSSITAA